MSKYLFVVPKIYFAASTYLQRTNIGLNYSSKKTFQQWWFFSYNKVSPTSVFFVKAQIAIFTKKYWRSPMYKYPVFHSKTRVRAYAEDIRVIKIFPNLVEKVYGPSILMRFLIFFCTPAARPLYSHLSGAEAVFLSKNNKRRPTAKQLYRYLKSATSNYGLRSHLLGLIWTSKRADKTSWPHRTD